jgi:hypothetical protein
MLHACVQTFDITENLENFWNCASPWPPLPLIWHCATGAHQPRWIGCSRSGRGQKVRIGRWANSVEIYSNILSFDLNISFNFKL